MTTVIRTTRNTESLAQDESVDFVSGIQNADIRTAGALDNWRLRITNYADAKFGTDPVFYQNARNTAAALMSKMRLRWRSTADAHVRLTPEEMSLMREPAIAMCAVIIAITDAIKAIQSSTILSGHAQRALYTMGRVMDAAGVPNNLRALR